jgi:hypothetical protein
VAPEHRGNTEKREWKERLNAEAAEKRGEKRRGEERCDGMGHGFPGGRESEW